MRTRRSVIHGKTEKGSAVKQGSSRPRFARRVVSAMMAVVLALGLMPMPAYAGSGDGASGRSDGAGQSSSLIAGGVEGFAPSEGADAVSQDGAASLEASAPDLSVEAQSIYDDDEAVDPYYFKDMQTGEIVTTLYTSGTYQLVGSDKKTAYTEEATPEFEYAGTNPRSSGSSTFRPVVKTVDENNDGAYELVVLENLCIDNYHWYYGDYWQMPSGVYRVRTSSASSGTYLHQRYRVVNDGMFNPEFDFHTAYGSENYYDFSVKPYAAGKSDEEYDTQSYVYNNGTGETDLVMSTPEQEPFKLASDTRLKLHLNLASLADKDNLPQIQSIGLWKAPDGDTLENYQMPEDDENPGAQGKYRALDSDTLSRIPQLLAKAGFDQLPSWPNYLNFTDDSRVSTLWERGEGDLSERYLVDEYDIANGGSDYADVVVDHAHFTEAAVESGLYFPVVTATFNGEAYTYAYYPLEVDATGTTGRIDPRIATKSLAKARVGKAYTATLEARSGALGTSAFAWAVTDGALPAGLTLDGATGTIAGTPTKAGVFTFTVTLTETVGGVGRTTARAFELRVDEAVDEATAAQKLSLGAIEYTPGPIWVTNWYNKSTYLDVRIPISLDLTDESLDLGQTELWYMPQVSTETDRDYPSYYVWHDQAAKYMSEDGATLQVPIPVEHGWALSGAKSLNRIRVFLIPRHNDGSLAFDPGKLSGGGTYSDGTPKPVEPIGQTLTFRYGKRNTTESALSYTFMLENGTSSASYGNMSVYADMPEMPYTSVEKPDVSFGSWIHFPSLDLPDASADSPIEFGRIRIWPYNGSASPANEQEQTIDFLPTGYSGKSDFEKEEDAGATFKLAPGTYAFVAEGAVPVYDENGVAVDGEWAWVDIADSVADAKAVSGTNPQQFVITVAPNVGTDTEWNGRERAVVDVKYTAKRAIATETHSLKVKFATEDGTYVEADKALEGGYADYETAWYRRVNAGTADEQDILVATGDNVLFGPSEYPLYVEAAPKGRAASFWKSTGKVAVSDKTPVVSVNVPRQPLFAGSFTLSAESGNVPPLGEPWGIVEVRTPLKGGDYTSFNVWADTNPVVVRDITAGSTVTFSPRSDLNADEVSYEVPDYQEDDFACDLVAPLPKGMIAFEGLKFTSADVRAADGTVMAGTTIPFALDDGLTDIKVERMYTSGSSAQWALVPFSVVDSSHILLKPETYYNDVYFVRTNEETTYRITMNRREADTPARVGVQAADYAAQEMFEVTLSPEKTSATVPSATLVSRSYANVPLTNPGNKACALLLYDATGALVDSGPVGNATLLRTPFLDAGDYTLYALDADDLPSGKNFYAYMRDFSEYVLRNAGGDHVKMRSFTVEPRVITDLNTLELPNWSAAELVDLSKSSVSVTSSFTDTVSIQMHAELADGETITDDAYLEVSTNQVSGRDGAGFMNPKALNFNGKAIALNRWNNMFENTQNMSNGNLRILLSEVKKANPACVGFPMNMTLIIPRTRTDYTEASVWLVSNNGKKRSLVGTCYKSAQEISLVAPPVVAWKTFSVYGETGPFADVTVYLSGVRVASARADEFGYYVADITLPESVSDDDEFTVSASAQWMQGNGDNMPVSAMSDVQKITYSTYFPAIERITMCYQSRPESDYDAVCSYYRGRIPNKYLSLYRAENENYSKEGDEHAKYFWIVEFANGDEVSNVEVSVPRSDSAVKLTVTDNLTTAKAWIPDVTPKEGEAVDPFAWGDSAVARSAAGAAVRAALSSKDLHSFVTQPEYFTYAPADLQVAFGFDGDLWAPMQGAVDEGTFRGYKSADVTESDLTKKIARMAEHGDIYVCTPADAERLSYGGKVTEADLTDASTQAANLIAANEGNVDEYLLIGDGSGQDQSMLKVHHVVTTETIGEDAVRNEVDAVRAGAQPSIDAVESWMYDSTSVPSAGNPAVRYKDNWVAQACGTRTTRDESYLYYILTVDGDGVGGNDNVQIETLEQYCIEDTSKHYYVQVRIDKRSMTLTSWDEMHGQRVVGTYTIADEQVEDGPCGFLDVIDRWDVFLCALDLALELPDGDATGDVTGQSADAEGSSLATQDIGEKIVGWFAGKVQGHIEEKVENAVDKSPTQAQRQEQKKKYREKTDYTKMENIERVCENGSRLKDFKEGIDLGKGDAKECGKTVLKAEKTALGWGGPVDAALDLADHIPAVKATSDWFWGNVDAYLEGAVGGKYSDLLYYQYRQQMNRKMRGKANLMYFFRYDMDPKLKKRLYDKWWKDPYGGRLFVYKQPDTTEDPSGMVYEAVLSNPVEGATVKLFTYNKNAGKYNQTVGESAAIDVGTFVDSTQFGIEENPQITGADGRYQWFVPEGYWQVRVSKEGYESVSTGSNPDFGIDATKTLYAGTGDEIQAAEYWMPVLPVQLDVNIPLVSKEAPVLQSVKASPEGISVTFSKYMQATTVTGKLFSVSKGAGTALHPTVKPVDAEAAGDGSGVMLARTFLLSYPTGAEPSAGNNEYAVSFNNASGTAKSYAGTAASSRETPLTTTIGFDSVSIKKASVSIDNAKYTYDGKAKTPTVTSVTLGGKKLVANTDYKVSYADNTNAGTAKVIIKGTGAYVDSVEVSFSIARAASSISLTAQKKVYTGKKLAFSGKVTKKGSSGKVTYQYYSNAKCTKQVKAANVKNVGVYYVKATVAADANYNAATSKAVKLTVNPKKTSLTKVTAASKAFTAKWKKQTKQTTGYQLQYSLKKNFKSAKTVTVNKAKTVSKKVTKLKSKKKYFVRVRTYKKVGSATYYSAWSPAKTVTTKK